MSPTSYQTAPPRIKIITQRGEAETNSDHGWWLNSDSAITESWCSLRAALLLTLASSVAAVARSLKVGALSDRLCDAASSWLARLLQWLSFLRSQASTIFLGSIASRSTCSSRILPSFPIRKLTRRGALYLST